jgi:hypothetical protein
VLQGTFESLGLSELLGLLAHSRKTGALWLDGGDATTTIYVADGRCCAAVSRDTREPLQDASSLLVRVVGLCFVAARAEDGSFRFSAEEPPWTCNETVDLEVASDELVQLLDEWRGIQAVIPSLACRIRLAEELAVDELVIERDRWRLLTAIDGRRTVQDLVYQVNRDVLEVCHELLALIDAGACQVVQPASASTSTVRSTGGKARAAVVDPEMPYGPGVESPHHGPRPDRSNTNNELTGAGSNGHQRPTSPTRSR